MITTRTPVTGSYSKLTFPSLWPFSTSRRITNDYIPNMAGSLLSRNHYRYCGHRPTPLMDPLTVALLSPASNRTTQAATLACLTILAIVVISAVALDARLASPLSVCHLREVCSPTLGFFTNCHVEEVCHSFL